VVVWKADRWTRFNGDLWAKTALVRKAGRALAACRRATGRRNEAMVANWQCLGTERRGRWSERSVDRSMKQPVPSALQLDVHPALGKSIGSGQPMAGRQFLIAGARKLGR
jgi:hypothetical protein